MWILVIFLVLLGIWFYYRQKKMSILFKNGIPGNSPHIILGNLFEMKGLSMVEKQNKLIKNYGKIVGYYSGAKSNILVADPELVKKILIKDFHIFTNRSIYLKYLHPTRRCAGALPIAKDNRWKQIRGLLSPAFSASKLKEMTPIIEKSIDSFLEIITNKSVLQNEFNIYELYQRLSLEIILKTAFGVEIDAQNDTNSELVKAVHKFLESKVNKIFFLIYVCFPEIGNVILFVRGYLEEICNKFEIYPISFILNTCSQIINLRKNHPGLRRNDILQAMLDSNLSDEDVSNILHESYDEFEEISKIRKQNDTKYNNKTNIQLTNDEIIMNCIVFLGGGYETSSTALAYVTHMLVNYPDVQEKIRQEVKELYEIEGKIDYNCVTKLNYMEWVINETLRIHPPLVHGSTRECSEDYKFNGMIIPKGATIAICTHFLHNDSEYWSEPEKFDPMRFSPERRHEIKMGSYQPFGGGPRNCIAQRLAYLEMKFVLAKILLDYRLEPGPNTEIGGLATVYKLLSVTPKNGVFVKAIKIY